MNEFIFGVMYMEIRLLEIGDMSIIKIVRTVLAGKIQYRDDGEEVLQAAKQ